MNNAEILEINDDTGFWDVERKLYEVYFPGKRESIPTELKIRDEGVIWSCYLVKAEYRRKVNQYVCYFKMY
jgi:hypothetical protein